MIPMVGLHLMTQGVLTERPGQAILGQFFRDAAKLLGVTIVAGPHFTADCAYVVIAESHLSIHLHGVGQGLGCWVDFFSCAEFNPIEARNFIQERLPWAHEIEAQVICRSALDFAAAT